MTNPNKGDFNLVSDGDDLQEMVGIDPYIPREWWAEPGFMSATRLGLTEDIGQRLAEHDPNRFRTELRTVLTSGVELRYVVMFLRDER